MIENGLLQAMDDGSLSSSGQSFSLVDGTQIKSEQNDYVTNNQEAIHELTGQLESSGIDSSPPAITEVAKVKYDNFFIRIFTESCEKSPRRRFFFEPIALLDPKSIISASHRLFKQDFVRFTIQMWNSDIRSKVLHRLQSLPEYKDLEINEDDISVMPFKEVYLDFKPGSIHQSLRLMEQPPSYARSSESIDFYFLCDLPSTAKVMAEDFHRSAQFMVKTWQLALKCKGLSLKNGDNANSSTARLKSNTKLHPTFLFNVVIRHLNSGTENSMVCRHTELEKQVASTKKSLREAEIVVGALTAVIALIALVKIINMK